MLYGLLHFKERFYILEDKEYKLVPLNRDKEYFISILNGSINEPENKSQRAMFEAMKEIKLRINSINNKLNFLKAIEKLEVMEFIENTEGDAIRIFQTVNDRGKPKEQFTSALNSNIYMEIEH